MTAHEQEPDHRFTLANERTFLAWVRTSLALLAAAVALVQLVPEFGILGGRLVLGVLLACLAVLAAVAGVLRWERVQRAMRGSLPLPTTRVPWSWPPAWRSSPVRRWSCSRWPTVDPFQST